MGGILKIVFLLFALLTELGYTQTSDDFGQNYCAVAANGTTDNLSCPESPIEGVACFDRSLLCDGFLECLNGEDEGNDSVFSSLECI